MGGARMKRRREANGKASPTLEKRKGGAPAKAKSKGAQAGVPVHLVFRQIAEPEYNGLKNAYLLVGVTRLCGPLLLP
jgi:hypothetical protein